MIIDLKRSIYLNDCFMTGAIFISDDLVYRGYFTAPTILPLTQIGMPCQYHNFKLSQYNNVDGQYAMSNTQGNAPSYSPLLLPVRPVPTFLLLANIGTTSHTTQGYSIFIPDQRFHCSYLIPNTPRFLTIPLLLTKDLIVFTNQRSHCFFRISL